MGLEAECTAQIGRKTSKGLALLESERLIFRGDFRLNIPFEAMLDVSVLAGTLIVKTEDQEARLELGRPMAERWLRLIKEPKGLFEKLEVGPESRVAVVDIHDAVFLTALRERVGSVADGRVPEGAPVIFFGADTRDSLRKIQLLRARMTDSGVLWIVRPKASKAISETDVYDAVRAAWLTDTKVVAFSKTHTAHKCVIPLELRGQAIPRPRFLSIPPSAPALAGAKTKPSKHPSRPSTRPAARTNAKKKSSEEKPKKNRR